MSQATPEVLMYTRALCGYCAAARDLLQNKGIDYTELDATLNSQLRKEMAERSGQRTFPQIFVGERHVGGYDDLVALEAAGQLDPLLAGESDDE